MKESKNNYGKHKRMWGVVTKYDAVRGFGFIKSKIDKLSYFVHVSQIQDRILEKGSLVEFVVGISKKTGKEQAENVIVIEAPECRRRNKGM